MWQRYLLWTITYQDINFKRLHILQFIYSIFQGKLNFFLLLKYQIGLQII